MMVHNDTMALALPALPTQDQTLDGSDLGQSGLLLDPLKVVSFVGIDQLAICSRFFC